AGPAGEARALVAQPGFEGRPELGEGAGAVDARLLDVGERLAEGGQAGPSHRTHIALEVRHLATVAGGETGADLDDLHLLKGPAALIRGGFQVNNQPMSHKSSARLGGSMWRRRRPGKSTKAASVGYR